jgi:hypothetical protein
LVVAQRSSDLIPVNARIRLREITISDFVAIAVLLGNGLGYSPDYFLKLLDVLRQRDTPTNCPKYGYLLEVDETLVGGIILIYASFNNNSRVDRRCHVTSWYVEPRYRPYAAMLAARAINRKDFTYVNLSARPATRPIIEAQGFKKYSAGQFLIFTLLYMFDRRLPVEVTTFGQNPPGHFSSDEFELMAAHYNFGCICIWCTIAARSYPFIFRSKTFKGLFPGVELIYCNDIDEFATFARAISVHFVRRGKVLLTMDANGPISGLIGKYFDDVEPRWYKGLKPRLGDLAFTQKALLAYPRRQI